jgi:hypothetical protein
MFEATTNPDSRWRVFWPDVGDRAGASDAVRISTLLLGIAAVSAVFGVWQGWRAPGRRPSQAPRHPASAWFAARQWPEWAPGVPIAGQVVSFFNTSG